VPGESAAGVQAEIESLIGQTATADPSFQATARCLLARNAFEISPEAAIVQVVRVAATRRLGRAPAFIGKPFWMDSAILADAGVETVIIGPKGGGAHTADEWVDLQSLEDLAAVLADAAIAYCG
jgi:acetylornithine deacetylase